MTEMKKTMPPWGPYSKKYMGISRIVDGVGITGARFDFIVHPTIWNSSVPVPNVTIPSNYHLWHCNGDYSYYSYRYELMWKDMIYADVSFTKMSEESYLMRCKFVNNTDLKQNCVLNAFSALEYPSVKYCDISLPENCILINALDYDAFTYAVSRPWDNQNTDGMKKGQFADYRFYGGFGLGDRCENYHVPILNLKPFGCEKGDKVTYSVSAESFDNPVVTVRYRTAEGADAEFMLNGKKVVLPESDEFNLVTFPYNKSENGIVFESLGTAGIELDFFAITESGEEDKISACLKERGVIPEIETEDIGVSKRISLTYPETNETYYVLTHNERTRQRTLDSGCLEDALSNRLSNGDHTYDELRETFSGSFKNKKSDDGFFHNTLVKSIYIEPNSEHTEYMVISKEKVDPLAFAEYESMIKAAESAETHAEFNDAGKKYDLSTEIMKTTLLTNVVYPLYKHGENVVHFTPGKRWDSFYTWDSGIIGVGVLEYSIEKSQYILETYLAEEDNVDYAFLLHGSLVPTQFAQYSELLKKSKNRKPLFALYDKMLRYYKYIAGITEGSTTGKFGNNLLTTYDYWYSCSGMDDYPAQVYMIDKQMMHKICPCISTSHIILAAKIMKMAAEAMGKTEDAAFFDNEINRCTRALNDLCWDEEAGYYSYTVYDDDKNVTGFLRNENGENMNKGMDGIYPLIAGAAEGERKNILLSHIKNPKEMWSESGISAVDMSASYYFDDGYWNGNVWMSHQWYIWKAMFDMGDLDFAFEIANRALNMWKKETDFSYNTYECFGIETQRGGWFHNFGGLSAPICVWANAYYRPASITAGFDLWIDEQQAETDSAYIKFKYFGHNEKYGILVCLSDQHDYEVLLNNEKIEYNQRAKGIIEITLSSDVKCGEIKINAID
ncbi:MAG: hypothetical protein K2K42_04290 [Eubacterium sp.]|nr:hypothetical protein [Eubacterium sp.]